MQNLMQALQDAILDLKNGRIDIIFGDTAVSSLI